MLQQPLYANELEMGTSCTVRVHVWKYTLLYFCYMYNSMFIIHELEQSKLVLLDFHLHEQMTTLSEF